MSSIDPPSSTRITVRAAAAEDLDLLVFGNQTMARVTEGRELDEETLRAGVLSALQDPSKARYLVAEMAGRAVGQLMLTLEWSDWRNGTFWWIQSVFVDETARRQGVYRALHDHVVGLAKKEPAVCGVRLYVERDNATAIATYRALGMKTCDYDIMEIDFSTPQS